MKHATRRCPAVPLQSFLFLLLFPAVLSVAPAAQTDIAGPDGSGTFGNSVRVLPNGNFVVTDLGFDLPGPVEDVGAVRLYSKTGQLISTLTGSTAGDMVGSDGITILNNGNFVVRSVLWQSAGQAFAGAVTWGHAETGFPGGPEVAVSAANSLVGSVFGDRVGLEVIPLPLPSGNYVVRSYFWNDGANSSVGAVTWGNGAGGTVGAVSAANSLVGSTAGDSVGLYGVHLVANGNYVVQSVAWDDGPKADVGAVTWVDGNVGLSGPISETNSLLGSHNEDLVGINGIQVLPTGNYLVRSSRWDNLGTAGTNAGAVTFCNGTTGLVGRVSETNSLVGQSSDDVVGESTVTILAHGHYVVRSPSWSNSGGTQDVGAVTWGNGNTGVVGAISDTNSLVGTRSGDQVGSGVTALTNGNYVVRSQFWSDGLFSSVGAVTLCNGSNGSTAGEVSPGNSLVGTTQEDQVGGGGVTALTNGHYVVSSPSWDNGAFINAGAVTWGNGNSGITGNVTSANSLVGDGNGYLVGLPGVRALTNGHYVVSSTSWNGARGAVTWANGTSASAGEVSAQNSLVGSTTGDIVGTVHALSNGNYVVVSSLWDNGAISDAGAVTWGNGNAGIRGVVSAYNSLVGTSASDQVGAITVLNNGNYVISSFRWDNNGVSDAGSVTWCDGTKGLAGAVSSANSLVGSSTSDEVSKEGILTLNNNNFFVRSQKWDNGGATDAGAVTWVNGATGKTGPVSSANSLVGSTAGDALGSGATSSMSGTTYLLHSRFFDGPDMDIGAITPINGETGIVGLITAANSVLGTATGGGSNLSHSYDASREQLVVGRPSSNIVSLFTPGSGTGAISFDKTLHTVSGGPNTATVKLVRTGGAVGPASVLINTVAGTAGADSDFVPPVINTTVQFADREVSKTFDIEILPNGLNEPNETFKVVISDPQGASLGSITSTTVRIYDSSDGAPPNLPEVSSPAANALVGVNAGGTITVTGTASDNRGISRVEVSLNGAPYVDATLTSVNGTKATFSAAITPVTGVNTLTVRSTDTMALWSNELVRTFRVARPLVVTPVGGGSVTTGFAPSSYREVGSSLSITATATATPAPGTIFAGWTLTGPSLAQARLVASDLVRPSITFIFREGMQLVAQFVGNPFTAGVNGTYKGVIQASPTLPDRIPLGYNPGLDGTWPNLSTEGFFSATMQSTGAFSASLTIDGLVLNFAGAFDSDGNARFGTARALTTKVARTGKPSLIVAFKLDGGVPFVAGTISGTVTANDHRGYTMGVSDILAERSHFNGTSQVVPAEYLGLNNGSGVFTTVFPALPLVSQPIGFRPSYYPQGDGIGTITVSKAGVVMLSGCTLADGTPATASTTLSQNLTGAFFIPLYNKKGFVRVPFKLDSAQPDSDIALQSGTSATWLRPAMDTHYYPAGWPEIINVGFMAARYTTMAGVSSLRAANGVPLQLPDADGNAELAFSDGQLEEVLMRTINVAHNTDAVTKVPTNDPTFTLTITRTTGLFSGTFRHTDQTTPSFKGILYQKGPTAGGYGYFRTTQPTPLDYSGESGGVTLLSVP